MKKPTVSEIRAHCGTIDDYGYCPYLLDLVSRMGVLLSWYRDNCPDCDDDNEKYCTPCKEARALLEEIKL